MTDTSKLSDEDLLREYNRRSHLRSLQGGGGGDGGMSSGDRTEQVMQSLGAMASGYAGRDTSGALNRIREISGASLSDEELARHEAATGAAAGQAAARSGAAVSEAEAARMAAATKPISYEYTPKAVSAGAPTGQRYGTTTEDLKRTPTGQAFVSRDPDTGFEQVDAEGLTLANTAAIGQLVRQRQEDEKRAKAALTAIRQQKADMDYGKALMNKQSATQRLRQLAGAGASEEERKRLGAY